MTDRARILEIAKIDPSAAIPAEPSDRGTAFYAVAGAGAIEAWRTLRHAADGGDFWPVLLGSRESLHAHREALRDPDTPSVATILEHASELDVRSFLRSRLEERAEEGDLPTGEWPADPTPAHDIHVHLDITTTKPRREVILALAPTSDPWAVPAFIPLGGWNECPGPEDHAAVLRHWHELFGAELVGFERDTIECLVRSPPKDRASALGLAAQQYAYAPDIVEQGIETIEALGSVLLNGTAWFFWWD